MRLSAAIALVFFLVMGVAVAADGSRGGFGLAERVNAAARTILGRDPSPDELPQFQTLPPAQVQTVAAIERLYLDSLAQDPDEQVQTVVRAYRAALRRDPSPAEAKLWMERARSGAIPFAVITGAVQAQPSGASAPEPPVKLPAAADVFMPSEASPGSTVTLTGSAGLRPMGANFFCNNGCGQTHLGLVMANAQGRYRLTFKIPAHAVPGGAYVQIGLRRVEGLTVSQAAPPQQPSPPKDAPQQQPSPPEVPQQPPLDRRPPSARPVQPGLPSVRPPSWQPPKDAPQRPPFEGDQQRAAQEQLRRQLVPILRKALGGDPDQNYVAKFAETVQNNGLNSEAAILQHLRETIARDGQLRMGVVARAFEKVYGVAPPPILGIFRDVLARSKGLIYEEVVQLMVREEYERTIDRSYRDAFGREPQAGEKQSWLDQGQLSLAELIDRHRGHLRRDDFTRGDTITRSYRSILKRAPNANEFRYWDIRVRQSGETYAEMEDTHRKYVAQNPSENPKPVPNPKPAPIKGPNPPFPNGKKERCFGAVGVGCDGGGNLDWLVPRAQPIGNGLVRQWVNVGSITHDSCCVRNPTGAHCREGDYSEGGDDRACLIEWRKAIYNWRDQRSWQADFGPYIGPDDSDDPAPTAARSTKLADFFGKYKYDYKWGEYAATRRLCAPAGTRLDESDAQFCCSGSFRQKFGGSVQSGWGVCAEVETEISVPSPVIRR